MTVFAIKFHVPSLNKEYLADASYQNNEYDIFDLSDTVYPIAHLRLRDDGIWESFHRWGPQFSELENKIFGAAILTNPELNKKITKWRDDCIKRLEKSVPRLKQEYEDAFNRLVKLRQARLKI